jgi:hypothetical protein
MLSPNARMRCTPMRGGGAGGANGSTTGGEPGGVGCAGVLDPHADAVSNAHKPSVNTAHLVTGFSTANISQDVE